MGALRKRVAVLVVGASAFVLWGCGSTGEPPGSGSGSGSGPAGQVPAARITNGWTELAEPPAAVDDAATLVWAGSELIAWGGCEGRGAQDSCASSDRGFSFNPTDGSWVEIPRSPIPGSHADGVWTGKEVIFFVAGGTQELDAVAYDPAEETWRMVASPPLDHRFGRVAVWTSSRVILWGGGDPNDPSAREGAAYDPSTDSWARIADAPYGLNLASAAWTGREMVVFGSLLDNRNHATTKTSVGAIYDPTTDRWSEIPPSDLSPQATSAVWVDARLVAWDYEVHSQEFDPSTGSWSDSTKMPLEFSECYPDSVVVSGRVFAFFCGQAALYHPARQSWTEIDDGPLSETTDAHGRDYPLWQLAHMAASNDTVYMALEGITIEDSGEPCYGCPDSPTSFWTYRPS
jgi:hypothetical protein